MSVNLRPALAVATALVASVAGIQSVTAQTTVSQFNIANITDLHGYVIPAGNHPGALQLECTLDAAAGELPQHFVSSGDSIGGSPFSSSSLDDEPALEALNHLDLVASAVGNHEFDRGYDDLTGRVDTLADFPYLGANVDGASDLPAFHIENAGDVRVAYVGTVTEETPTMVNHESVQSLNFSDPVAATNKWADELIVTDQADVVVALYHEGIVGDEAWSDNVDLVFAGHTHMVRQPELAANGETLVMQAGNYGHALADVDLSFNHSTDELTVDDARIVEAAEISACEGPNDPALAQIIADAETASSVIGDQTVTTIPDTFHLGKNPAGEAGSNHGVESQLNNMVAEAVRWDIADATGVTPDMAIMNAGGLRVEVEGGDVTYANLFDNQPFGGENTVRTYTGAQLKELLEDQWRSGSTRPIENLGVSDNVTYTFDNSRPEGDRITSITIDGEHVDPTGNYTVAGSKFILGGGSGFEAFKDGSPMANLGVIDVQSTIDYLAAHPGLTPRGGQSAVSITPHGEFVAGQEITMDLESLVYTQGESATEVTVSLGEENVTAPITTLAGDADLNNAGQATVTLTVPEHLSGPQNLRITTDAGTDISLPVEIQAVTVDSGSSSSNAGWLVGILGVFAVVLALMGQVIAPHLPFHVPA